MTGNRYEGFKKKKIALKLKGWEINKREKAYGWYKKQTLYN